MIYKGPKTGIFQVGSHGGDGIGGVDKNPYIALDIVDSSHEPDGSWSPEQDPLNGPRKNLRI